MPKVTPNPPIRLAVLLSGAGRTLSNFLELIDQRFLSASVEVVITSNPRAGGLEIARRTSIPYHIIERVGKPQAEFDRRVTAALDRHAFDLILMCGWICFWTIPEKYAGRVMNIHPSLLPAFGGKGMFGKAVHEAVLAAGVKLSGCTVHFADNQYDTGPIIVQRACPVFEKDTPDTLAARVFAQECIAYPSAVRLFAQKRLKIDGRRVRITSDLSETRDAFVMDEED
jgi:formyltetrahydrofolate-dependent phosphoribosylglycinamide formyltransferase